jgi:hypothetical protein
LGIGQIAPTGPLAEPLLALEVPVDEMIAATETYDGLPSIPVHVLALD